MQSSESQEPMCNPRPTARKWSVTRHHHHLQILQSCRSKLNQRRDIISASSVCARDYRMGESNAQTVLFCGYDKQKLMSRPRPSPPFPHTTCIIIIEAKVTSPFPGGGRAVAREDLRLKLPSGIQVPNPRAEQTQSLTL